MAASFSFELLKLGKRSATWVLGALLVLLIVVFDYYQFYASITSLQEGGTDPTGQVTDIGEFEDFLLPESVPVNVTGLLSQFGGPLALILGALAAGSEYGWGTYKATLTQGLGRTGVLASKLLAVGAVLLVFAFVALCTGALSSYVVAGLLEEPANWPPIADLLRGLGVTCLVLGAWGSFGIFLATLFRGTALAIGLGLVYGTVIEGLIFGFADRNAVVETLTKVLLTKNSGDLSNSLGEVPRQFAAPDPADPAQAALIVASYVVVPLLLSALLFWRRDVT